MVNKKLIGNNNNDDIIDNNDESKCLDIIVGYISSAILRLKSKELLKLNEPTISNVFNLAEMTGLNETLKLHQHTIKTDHDDCDNKCFHDFDNKEDL